MKIQLFVIFVFHVWPHLAQVYNGCDYQHLKRSPDDCAKFLACNSGFEYVMDCVHNLYFHEGTQRCEYKYDVPDCLHSTTRSTTEDLQPQTTTEQTTTTTTEPTTTTPEPTTTTTEPTTTTTELTTTTTTEPTTITTEPTTTTVPTTTTTTEQTTTTEFTTTTTLDSTQPLDCGERVSSFIDTNSDRVVECREATEDEIKDHYCFDDCKHFTDNSRPSLNFENDLVVNGTCYGSERWAIEDNCWEYQQCVKPCPDANWLVCTFACSCDEQNHLKYYNPSDNKCVKPAVDGLCDSRKIPRIIANCLMP